MPETSISVIIPVFNEAPNILAQARQIQNAIGDFPGGYELIFVDDGSTDATFSEIEKAEKERGSVRGLKLAVNRGQVAAMVEGLRQAKGRVLVTMDGDLQNDPLDIPAMVEMIDGGADMVCGWRADRKDPLLGKRVPSIIFNTLLRLIFGVPCHDNSCTLRAYRPEAILALNLYPRALSFIPVLAHKAGFLVAELVVRHHPRAAGQAKYDSPKRFFYTFYELAAIAFGFRKSALPAKVSKK